MTVNQLKEKIIKNEYPNLLVFTGPETKLKTFYLSKMSHNWNKISDYKTLNFGVKSIIAQTNYYLIDGDSFNNITQSELSSIKSKMLQSTNKYVIIFYSEEKLNKILSDELGSYEVKFEHLNINKLLEHFKHIELSDGELTELFEICGYDYIKIELEIQKILAYTKEKKLTPSIAYELLKKEEIIQIPIGDVLFNFTNPVIQGNITQVNYWLYKIKQTEEPILGIIKTLYNGFKNLYAVKATQKNKDARSKIGLEQNRIYVISKNLNIYNEKELERNLRILEFIEQGIKTGQVSEKYALDYLTVNLLV